MIEFLKNWVITIITLALFIILLEIIIPSGKIKKFINLISGFILIIAIINPFLGLFKNGIDIKQFQIADSNFIDKNEIEKSSEILEDNQMKQITNTYRNKLIQQIVECLSDIKGIKDVKGDVIINEDYKSDTFGDIKRIYVNLKLVNKQNSIENIPKVEKITIEGNEKKDIITKNENSIKLENKLKDEIENKLNKIFGVSKEIIVISLEE